MNFDIKDVKSWANRHDVKIGDEGYFARVIGDFLYDNLYRDKISEIDGNDGYPFTSKEKGYTWAFFLPLDKVKKDKPKEKKYRPFKTIDEINDLFNNEHNDLIGMLLHLRDKQNHSYERTVLVTAVDRIDEEIKKINKCSMEYLFNYFEVYVHNKGEWLPFGVEVEEDE